MKGLFIHKEEPGLHCWGIQAINSPSIYDKLKAYFYAQSKFSWFLQGDSMMSSKDKSWLFIEFFEPLNAVTAKALCQKIAKDIGETLEIQ